MRLPFFLRSAQAQGLPRPTIGVLLAYGLTLCYLGIFTAAAAKAYVLPKPSPHGLGLAIWLIASFVAGAVALRLRRVWHALQQDSLGWRLLNVADTVMRWLGVLLQVSYLMAVAWRILDGFPNPQEKSLRSLDWLARYWSVSFAILLASMAFLWVFWLGFRRFERHRRWLVSIMVPLMMFLFSGAHVDDMADMQKGFVDGWNTADRATHAPEPLTNQKDWAEAKGSLFLLLFSISVAVGMSASARLRNREDKLQIEKLEADVGREKVARELAEAHLKLLQAQIEPHFLFNTLGALQQQAEGKAPEAAALAGDLIRFLRGSMHSLRADCTSLASEGELLTAYLGIMQARLGDRLRFAIDLPPELARCQVPTVMLLTLAENALKHGIEPHPPGGEVRVAAAQEGASLVLTVADTGRGVSDIPGSGVGLENIRSRLHLLYGDAASLELEENEPQGFVARIRLPQG